MGKHELSPKTLDDIIRRVVEARQAAEKAIKDVAQPERIILFGSAAPRD